MAKLAWVAVLLSTASGQTEVEVNDSTASWPWDRRRATHKWEKCGWRNGETCCDTHEHNPPQYCPNGMKCGYCGHQHCHCPDHTPDRTCDAEPAPVSDHRDATCGSRHRHLMLERHMDAAAAHEQICREEPVKCAGCCWINDPSSDACDSVPAPNENKEATCGSRYRWLMSNKKMTYAESVKQVCKESPWRCGGCCRRETEVEVNQSTESWPWSRRRATHEWEKCGWANGETCCDTHEHNPPQYCPNGQRCGDCGHQHCHCPDHRPHRPANTWEKCKWIGNGEACCDTHQHNPPQYCPNGQRCGECGHQHCHCPDHVEVNHSAATTTTLDNLVV